MKSKPAFITSIIIIIICLDHHGLHLVTCTLSPGCGLCCLMNLLYLELVERQRG